MNADEILPYVAGGSVMIAGLVVGLIARSLVTRKLAGWASKSESRVDDAIVASLRRPMPWWGLLIGIHIGVGLMPLEPRYVEISGQVVESILILSCTLWAADLLVRLLELATQARAGHDIPLTGLARNITRGLIFGIGGMILLGSFEAAPVLTSFAVTGVIFGAVYLLMATRKLLFGPVVHEENRTLTDLNVREVTLMLPIVILCVWIGVKPGSLLDKTSASIDRLVERIEDARVAQQTGATPAERVSTLAPSTDRDDR